MRAGEESGGAASVIKPVPFTDKFSIKIER